MKNFSIILLGIIHIGNTLAMELAAQSSEKSKSSESSSVQSSQKETSFWDKSPESLKIALLSQNTRGGIPATIRELARYQRVSKCFRRVATDPIVVYAILHPCTTTFTAEQDKAIKEFFSQNLRINQPFVRALYNHLDMEETLAAGLIHGDQQLPLNELLIILMTQICTPECINASGKLALTFFQTFEEKEKLVTLVKTFSQYHPKELSDLLRRCRDHLQNNITPEQHARVSKLLEDTQPYTSCSSLTLPLIGGIVDAWCIARGNSPLQNTPEMLMVAACLSHAAGNEKTQLELIAQNKYIIKKYSKKLSPAFWAAALLIATCKGYNHLIEHFLTCTPFVQDGQATATQASLLALLSTLSFTRVLPFCNEENITLFLTSVCELLNILPERMQEQLGLYLLKIVHQHNDADPLFECLLKQYGRHEICSRTLPAFNAATNGDDQAIEHYITNGEGAALEKAEVVCMCAWLAAKKGHLNVFKKIHDEVFTATKAANPGAYQILLTRLKAVAAQKNHQEIIKYIATLNSQG